MGATVPSADAVRDFFTNLVDVTPFGDPAGQKAVYKCVLPDGRQGVLKVVVLPTVGEDDAEAEATYNEAVGRLRREIAILSSIDSPYVARLAWPHEDIEIDMIDGEQCAFYLEERVPGPSVEQMLATACPLAHRVVARMGADVARAIHEFWQRDKVHRDVKPANIVHNEPDDVFVLLDAGYALDLTGPSFTRVMGIAGTLPYFSPEQLDLAGKRNLDFRSDLYSLGVVMYSALACQHPYFLPGMSSDEQLRAIATIPPHPVTPLPGTEHTWEVVMRLLEKQPHARYRSCLLVADELGRLY